MRFIFYWCYKQTFENGAESNVCPYLYTLYNISKYSENLALSYLHLKLCLKFAFECIRTWYWVAYLRTIVSISATNYCLFAEIEIQTHSFWIQCYAIQCKSIQILQKINTWSLYLSRFVVPQPLAFAMILHYSMCVIVFVSVCFGLSSCFPYPIPSWLFFQLLCSPFYSSPVTFYSTRHYNSQANNSKKWDKRINFGLGLRMVNIVKIQQWGGDNERDDKNKPISCKCWIDSVFR